MTLRIVALAMAVISVCDCSTGTPRKPERPFSTVRRGAIVARVFVDRGGATEPDYWRVKVTVADGTTKEVLTGLQGDGPRLVWLPDGRLRIDNPPPLIEHFTNYVESFPDNGEPKRTTIVLGDENPPSVIDRPTSP